MYTEVRLEARGYPFRSIFEREMKKRRSWPQKKVPFARGDQLENPTKNEDATRARNEGDGEIEEMYIDNKRYRNDRRIRRRRRQSLTRLPA